MSPARSSAPSIRLAAVVALALSSSVGDLRAGASQDGPDATAAAPDEASKAAVEKAAKLLEDADPEFRVADFDAKASPTVDGMFHRVEFRRKAGAGKGRYEATIPVPPRETAASRDPALRPGSPAPKTAGVDPDGKPVDLADLKGKAVVLVFCVPNCPPCKDFYANAAELYRDFDGRPFAILEVMGGPTIDAAREAARAAALPWPVICEGEPDDDSNQARWKVEIFTTFWLIDPEGRIVAGPSLRPPAATDVEAQVRRAQATR